MQRVNNISGTLPSLAGMPVMQVMRLAHNLITGTLPSDMFTSSRLQLFSIEYNNLTGPLPDYPPLSSWLQSSAPPLTATAVTAEHDTSLPPPTCCARLAQSQTQSAVA